MNLRSVIVGAACTLVWVAGLGAQTNQGALRGAVRDSIGVIPGAEVTLIYQGTRVERSAMTNDAGEYAFKSVLPGTYTVCVSLPGFNTEERKNLRIGPQPSLALDFTLELGTISAEFTVAGDGPLIEAESVMQASPADHAFDDDSSDVGRQTTCSEVS